MSLIEKAINSLTPKQREVWIPIMQECRSQYETARLLGLKRPTVQDRLKKAKKRVRAFLQK